MNDSRKDATTPNKVEDTECDPIPLHPDTHTRPTLHMLAHHVPVTPTMGRGHAWLYKGQIMTDDQPSQDSISTSNQGNAPSTNGLMWHCSLPHDVLFFDLFSVNSPVGEEQHLTIPIRSEDDYSLPESLPSKLDTGAHSQGTCDLGEAHGPHDDTHQSAGHQGHGP